MGVLVPFASPLLPTIRLNLTLKELLYGISQLFRKGEGVIINIIQDFMCCNRDLQHVRQEYGYSLSRIFSRNDPLSQVYLVYYFSSATCEVIL